MEVIISNNVLIRIDEYSEALTEYPISATRAHEKINNMLNVLYNLGNSVSTPPICMYKDLGQRFTTVGQAIYKNLKRFNYKDESGFQWAFACLFNKEADRITIVKMMPSNQIKEEGNKQVQLVIEFWKRMQQIIK